MGFKENLKLLRKSKGMTQEEFGKLINKSKLTIIRYESGETFPNFETLKEICSILDISSEELFTNNIHKSNNDIDEIFNKSKEVLTLIKDYSVEEQEVILKIAKESLIFLKRGEK